MGLCFDTVVAAATNPTAAGAAASFAVSGDPAMIRSTTPGSKTYLEGLTRHGATLGFAQLASNLFHDPLQGIRVTPGESPGVLAIPPDFPELLTSGDTLNATISGGAAETDILAAHIYYSDLVSVNARLAMPADLAGNIKHLKPVRVACVTAAAPGVWVDTALNATEDLLQAGNDYAVIGYTANVAVGVVAVRGTATGNFRAGGPGAIRGDSTTEYFARLSKLTGRPHIPVINASDKAATFVSVVSSAASVAVVVELMLAELITPWNR